MHTNRAFFIALLIISTQSIFAQTKLPVIKATSKKVAINDGGYLDKDAWTLSPAARPDIYTAERTRQTKKVTFYTDIDSINVTVKPGSAFDFIILLNGKDSCYTRIVSAIPPENKNTAQQTRNDTIPFTLTSFNIIHVRSVINNTDTVNLHFDLGSFDFRLTRDAIQQKTHLLSNQSDVLAGKAKPNFNKLNKVETIQMGNATWHNPELVPTGNTAQEMDGRFGWNLFEGKIVEINYNSHLIIVHNRLPATKNYTKAKLEFIHSFVCLKGSMIINGKPLAGTFLLDTGSDQALILDSSWAVQQHFPVDSLKLLKTTILKDPRGAQYVSRLVVAPSFKLNKFTFSDVPTLVLGSLNPTGFQINFLGNDIMKRFNIILDFSHDDIYLKPNELIKTAYKGNS